MNFKEQLKENTIKNTDERIRSNILFSLNMLENKAELEEHKIQMKSRRDFLCELLVSFDRNMEMIQQINPRRAKRLQRKQIPTQNYVLDQIMKKQIDHNLNELYDQIREKSKDKNIDSQLAQIMDRHFRICNLFENFDENIQTFERKKHSQNKEKQQRRINSKESL